MLPVTATGTWPSLSVRPATPIDVERGLGAVMANPATRPGGVRSLFNTTVGYGWEVPIQPLTVRRMTPEEPDTLDELIADCADIPTALTERRPVLPRPRVAARWSVSDSCQAQVADLDAYV